MDRRRKAERVDDLPLFRQTAREDAQADGMVKSQSSRARRRRQVLAGIEAIGGRGACHHEIYNWVQQQDPTAIPSSIQGRVSDMANDGTLGDADHGGFSGPCSRSTVDHNHYVAGVG